MIVAISAIVWLLSLSLVVALSLAARRGDELESLRWDPERGEPSAAAAHGGRDGASQNRHP